MSFLATALTVSILLLYAVPGFILVKCKAVKPDSLSAFSRVLLYVCQPCLTIYSFQKASYSLSLFKNMSIVFGLAAAIMLAVILLLFVIFYKKYPEDASYRTMTLAAVLGNVGFLGVPVLERLMPDFPEAVCFSAVIIVAMNLISWTVSCYVLTSDRKFFSLKKMLINPPMLTLLVALPLFFTNTQIPEVLMSSVNILAKMTTPLCMLIVGMRFATADLKRLFSNPKLYLSSALKLIVFPLIAFCILLPIPIDKYIKNVIFILFCMPSASLVLNFGELFNVGQESAAGSILLSTALSIVTVPLMLMLC